jgi:hypothetical protein
MGAFPTNPTLKVKEAHHHVAFLRASKTTQKNLTMVVLCFTFNPRWLKTPSNMKLIPWKNPLKPWEFMNKYILPKNIILEINFFIITCMKNRITNSKKYHSGN